MAQQKLEREWSACKCYIQLKTVLSWMIVPYKTCIQLLTEIVLKHTFTCAYFHLIHETMQ